MIALFHAIPTLVEVKKNFIFFDEMQTSESFIKANFKLLSDVPRLKPGIDIDDFKREFDFLLEKEIIKSKEDIELRLIPETGGFNAANIDDYLRDVPARNDEKKKYLVEFYTSLIAIREKYGIQIIGHDDGQLIPAQIDSETFFRRALAMDFLPTNIVSLINEFSSVYSRVAAIALNNHFLDNNYFPLIGQPRRTPWMTVTKDFINKNIWERKENLLELIIKNVPIPAPSVSWEQLIDFKSDPDSRVKRLRMRDWITEISRKDFTFSEMSGKLEYLLNDYALHMEYHNMKYDRGQLETILLPTIEILENLARVNVLKAAKMAFELNKKKIELLLEETKFPGKEIAYLYKIQNFLK